MYFLMSPNYLCFKLSLKASDLGCELSCLEDILNHETKPECQILKPECCFLILTELTEHTNSKLQV